jgi:hypothetical protein
VEQELANIPVNERPLSNADQDVELQIREAGLAGRGF